MLRFAVGSLLIFLSSLSVLFWLEESFFSRSFATRAFASCERLLVRFGWCWCGIWWVW